MHLRLLLALAGVLSTLAAQNSPLPRFTDPARPAKLRAAFPELEQIFERYRSERRIPGLVFGVVIDGDLAHVKGLGVRNAGTKEPVTAETVFRIASMTKSFTAAAILKLRDEGRLSLDDPVAKWIPEFGRVRYPTADTAPVTVRQLLTHGTGLPEDNPWGDRQLHRPDGLFSDWLKAGLPFSTAPDTAYEYSNYGFALAGRVIERAARMPYRDYLERNILAPLGMRASTLEPSAVPRDARALGYRLEGGAYAIEEPLAHGAFGAMGGLLTSARDLGRYVAWQLAAYPPRDEAEDGPLRRSSRREMQRVWRTAGLTAARSAPDAPFRAAARGYGYGLVVVQDCRFDHIVGHGGGLPGFGSYMMWLPDYGVGVFYMGNLTYVGSSGIVDEAFDALNRTGALERRKLPPSPALVSARDGIFRLWQGWDEAEAQKLAADNLFLDRPAKDRRDEIQTMKAELGNCGKPGEVTPENWLRGTFRMSCDRGFVDVTFTLAPTMPPLVQHLQFSMARAPEPRVRESAQALAAQLASPPNERLRRIAAPQLSVPALEKQLSALRLSYGACKSGETLRGNGRNETVLRLNCERGALDLGMKLDEQSRITSVVFNRPAGTTCAP